MKMKELTRGERNWRWIENYCLVPHGPDKGKRVTLTPAQRDIVRRIYDGDEQPEITGPLAAYLALLHVCGLEAKGDFRPAVNADGPRLREVVTRDGATIYLPRVGDEISARGRMKASLSKI